MQIKDPKFKEGQKVRDIEDGDIYTVVEINRYSFSGNEYWYELEADRKKYTYTRPESKLELYQEPPKTVWNLQKGDKCFFINSIGSMIPVKWDGTYCAIRSLEIGNAFLTKEEAENEVERRKIEAEMLRLGGRRKFKFDGDNYGIYYCDGINVAYYCNIVYQGLIYFDTTKDSHDAIEKIGEDRIKKYIFGVES